MTPGRHLLSLHAAVEEGADREATLVAIKAVLLERFDVAHATIQLESPDRCADDVEAPAPGAHRH